MLLVAGRTDSCDCIRPNKTPGWNIEFVLNPIDWTRI